MIEPGRGCLLPLPLPDSRSERTVLFAVRRMAAHGLRDVHAAWLLIELCSTRFRRPLVLLRAFMLELAHASRSPIRVAPLCAPRMTEDEGLIMAALSMAANDAAMAGDTLARLTRSPCIAEPLSAAMVFGRALDEIAALRRGG